MLTFLNHTTQVKNHMPTKREELLKEQEKLKRLAEEKLKQDEQNNDKAQRDRSSNELLAAQAAQATQLSPVAEVKPKPQEHFKVQSKGPINEDWKEILKDYEKIYPKPTKDNTLSFPTKEDALKFFAEQASANPPRKFLASQVDAQGQYKDYNVFSCGDGQVYKGSFEQIKQDLSKALEKDPKNQNIVEGLATIERYANPAQNFKSTLKAIKPNPEAKSASEELAPSSLTPNPLSTTPKLKPQG
jgi:hypothetical protein